MKVEWSRSSLWIVLAGIVLVLAFYILGQRVILAPYQQQVVEKEATLAQEQKILTAIESNQEESQREQILTSRTIQQQLPVIPLIDQLLIGLDRAENASTSLINSIAISDSESTIPIVESENEPEENGLNDSPEETDVLEEDVPDEPVEDEAEALIEGLHTLQFTVDVTSENYDEMVSFMKEIQSLSRVIQIDSIQFDVPKSENELGYSIVLNSYYQPLYANLANEAPQYHYGGSPNKVNPFAIEQWDDSNSSVSTRTDAEEELDEEDQEREEEEMEEQSDSELESQL